MAEIRRQWSGVIEDLPSSILDTRVQELPRSVLDKLGLMLFGDGRGEAGNWEGLADELGITSHAEIEAIRRRAEVEHIFPGCRLLLDWMAGEGRTVYVLLQSLKTQRRLDCLEYLVQKCYGLHSMDLHIKIEYEEGRHEFKSVSTQMNASLASSLENILGYLPNYVITGPCMSVDWNTPARLLKGKQLSVKKVDETDSTRCMAYGGSLHHVGMPTYQPQTRSNDFNRLDMQANEPHLTYLKHDDQYYGMSYNIPVSRNSSVANIKPTLAPTHLHTGTPPGADAASLGNYGNSVTNLKHTLVPTESNCNDAMTTYMTTSEWPSTHWPALQTDASFSSDTNQSAQQTIVKDFQRAEFEPDDTLLKTPVVRPPYHVTSNQNKLCIKEHFVKYDATTGPMSVQRFLTENTTYANPSSNTHVPTVNPSNTSDNKTVCFKSCPLISNSAHIPFSVPSSTDSSKRQPVQSAVPTASSVLTAQSSPLCPLSSASVKHSQSVPAFKLSSVPSPHPLPSVSSSTALLKSQTARYTSATNECILTPSTSANSPAYIDLNHPVISINSRRCVPPSTPFLDQQQQQNYVPLTGHAMSYCAGVPGNSVLESTTYSKLRSENLFKRPDGCGDVTGSSHFTDMDVSEPGDRDTGSTRKSSECVIQQSSECVIQQRSDGYFGFSDIANAPGIECASHINVCSNELSFTNVSIGSHTSDSGNEQNMLESGSSFMEFVNNESSSNLMNSKSTPLMICASSNGYFGFAEHIDVPMEPEQCSYSMVCNQSDSVLANRARYRCLDSGVDSSTPITRLSNEQGTPPNKKVTWQLTYSTVETGSDEDDTGYIDMSGTAPLQRDVPNDSGLGGRAPSLSSLYSTGSVDDDAGYPNEYTYIPLGEGESVKPRSMSLPQVRPPLPAKRRRADSSPIFGGAASKSSEMNEVPGWCPDETEQTIHRTMNKFKNEDGNFIVWRMRNQPKFVISVSHLGEIRHYVIHEKCVGNQVHYYVFPAGKETADLRELITFYQTDGLRGPDRPLTGSRGKKWQKFLHIQLKTPLRVKHATTVVRKEKLSG